MIPWQEEFLNAVIEDFGIQDVLRTLARLCDAYAKETNDREAMEFWNGVRVSIKAILDSLE